MGLASHTSGNSGYKGSVYEALAQVPAAGNIDFRPTLLNAFTGDLSTPACDANELAVACPRRVGHLRVQQAHQPAGGDVANGATAAVLLQPGSGWTAAASQ